MPLRGGFRGYSAPLNAPLYGSPPWLYRGVEAVIVLVSLERSSVEPLLPRDLEPAGDPVQAAVWVARYPFSTLGPYSEGLVAVQVLERSGGVGYYVPYIYVDSDAALAAGREVLGAPKKFAHIEVGLTGSSVRGVVERTAVTLIEAGVRLEARASPEILRALLPEKLTMYGLRVIPGVGGRGRAQLVEWYVRTWFYETPAGVDAWTGPAVAKLSSGPEDPLGGLRVTGVLGGFYARLDMELGVIRVVSEAET